MTEQQARTAANVVMIAGAAGAAFYIVRKPPLRRLAWHLARSWAKGPLLVWALAEVRRAWIESASAGPVNVSARRSLPALSAPRH
jgi:hypothetical protein